MADRLSDDSIKNMAVADDKDPFEDLPEEVLQLVVSFMDSRDAVGAARLARRWRNLWKSLPSIRLCPVQYDNVQAFNNFVNKLLEFRDRTAPLDVCEICPYPYDDESEAHQYVESWVQYALSCKVSVLRIKIDFYNMHEQIQLSNRCIISKHLTVLDLEHVIFEENPLDFSSCQKLEVLQLHGCSINLEDIFPKSLRYLKIEASTLLFTHTPRTRLSAPGLVTLELADGFERTPLLESFPSLVTAYIKIAGYSEDLCFDNYFGDCGNESCDACYGVEDDCSVILEGLSGATNLELIMERSMIFSKDLKWCPMFRKLKTLLLNEWCVGANFTGLLYFLQHSPILERLTLQLRHGKYARIKTGESYNPKEHFLVSEYLKIVEIYCRKEEMICQILKILGSHGVNPAQIDIKHNYRDSDSFSFKQ